MRIAAPIGTAAVGSPAPARDLVEEVREAERAGHPSAWCVHLSRDVDALSVFAAAALSTERIELGVGVVPSYPRHPLALAQQAATVQSLTGGRLTLGVGVSHRPTIEGMFGLPYHKPVDHLREYLTILDGVLTAGACSFSGDFYQVEADLGVPEPVRVPVLVGGLSPGMVRLAGTHADGLVTWLVGPRTLEQTVVPALRRAADEAGRPAPRVVAAIPVTVCDDEVSGRSAAAEAFARYGTLENYRRLLDRQGVSSPADLAVVGDETTLAATLGEFAEAGATELWPVVYPADVSVDPDAARTRCGPHPSRAVRARGAGGYPCMTAGSQRARMGKAMTTPMVAKSATTNGRAPL